jgi:uncharacterized membrane protein (UPF0182 family)
VVYQNQIVMERTLDAAIARLFGVSAPVQAEAIPEAPPGRDASARETELSDPGAAVPNVPDNDSAAPPLPDLSTDARVRAHQLYERALRAQREGRWAEYGEALNALGETLAELRAEADGLRGESSP